MDAQAAIIFELRHFPRYREFTKRLLARLEAQWKNDPRASDLIEELDLTRNELK